MKRTLGKLGEGRRGRRRRVFPLLITNAAPATSTCHPAQSPELCAERRDEVGRVVWVVRQDQLVVAAAHLARDRRGAKLKRICCQEIGRQVDADGTIQLVGQLFLEWQEARRFRTRPGFCRQCSRLVRWQGGRRSLDDNFESQLANKCSSSIDAVKRRRGDGHFQEAGAASAEVC